MTHRARLWSTVYGIALAIVLACAQTATAQEAGAVSGNGVLNSVDADGQSVNLTHEPIPALGWPTMTMDLQVDSGVDLFEFEAGQAVRFTLARGADGIYMIDWLAPAE